MIQQTHPWRSKILIGVTLTIMIWVVFINHSVQAHADYYGLFTDTSEEVKKILNDYQGYLVQGNVMLYLFRWIGWALILLLVAGVKIFSQANLDILNIGNFFDSVGFTAILNKFNALHYGLLLMAVLLLFAMMLFGKKVEISQSITNLMICMILVMAMPSFVTTFLGVVTDIGTNLSSGENGVDIGERTVIDNTADLTVFAQNEWTDPTNIQKKNDVTDIRYIRITQQITKPDEFGGGGVLGYNLDFVNGKEIAAKFDPDVGFGKRWAQDFVGEGYYRWHVNFVTVIVTLIALNFAYILSGIRMGRMMIELAFNQGFATLLAFSDFRTMTRLKQVLLNIIGTLCTIVAMFATFSVFSAFASFIVEKQLSGVSYTFALIGAIWFVIDGPTMIQKVLGVDAGVQSAWGLLGGAMGVKAGMGAVKSAGGVAAAAASLGAQAAGFAGGAAAGIGSNIAEDLAKGLNEVADKDDDKGGKSSGSGGSGSGLNAKDDSPENEQDNSSETQDDQTNDDSGSETPGEGSAGDSGESKDNSDGDSSDSGDDPSGLSGQEDTSSADNNSADGSDKSDDSSGKGLNEQRENESAEQKDAGNSNDANADDSTTLSDSTEEQSPESGRDDIGSEQDRNTPSDEQEPSSLNTESPAQQSNKASQTSPAKQASSNKNNKPTLRNKLANNLKNKVKNSKYGKAAQKGYNMTKRSDDEGGND